MGLFLCPVCAELLTENHECEKGKIEARMQSLVNATWQSDHKCNEMQNAVLMLMHQLPSLDGEKVEVDTAWLCKLWDTAGSKPDDRPSYRSGSPEQFMTKWTALHQILCASFRLFRSKHGGLLSKMKWLRERCIHAKEVFGYKDDKFDLSADDLVGSMKSMEE